MNVVSDSPLKVKFSILLKFCFEGVFGRTQEVKAE